MAKQDFLNSFLRWKTVYLMILILFLSLTGYFYQNKSLSLHFVDEEDNLVLGSYLLKGDKIYSDLFAHHQPLAYVISAGIQKVTDPNSIFLLIKRHRESMILWGILFSILIYLRFGLVSLLPLSILELSKLFLLGNVFLSESLAIYPLIYFLGIVLSDQKIKSKLELFFLGVCFGLVFFLLAPLWPVLLVGLILLLKKLKQQLLMLKYFIVGGVVIGLIILPFISIPDYFYNAFYINFIYYIPTDSTSPTNGNFLLSFISPLLTFLKSSLNIPSLQIMQFMSLVLLILAGILLWQRKYLKIGIILVILGLANIRFTYPGEEYYRGFHLLPWFGILIFSPMFLDFNQFKNKYIKKLVLLLMIFTLGIALFNAKDTLFKTRDLASDYDINYSRQFTAGEAVRIMKNDQDKLFVAPDEWLVYYQSDIAHASKMINYYPWMTTVPSLKREVDQTFQNNPPTFFYCSCSKDLNLDSYLAGYQRLEKDNHPTDLYVLKTRVQSLSTDQKTRLQFFNFNI